MAARKKTEKIRQQIVEATSVVLYRKGFNLMSFSDIAEASAVPRGNLYYYFKTKDEVFKAVVDHRLDNMRQMLEHWDEEFRTPQERLLRFARMPLNQMQEVTRFGCPIGSLNMELGKCQPELQQVARRQFDIFREWLARQFGEFAPARNAEDLALHLLTLIQGMAVLAQAYKDPRLVEREVAETEKWILQLGN